MTYTNRLMLMIAPVGSDWLLCNDKFALMCRDWQNSYIILYSSIQLMPRVVFLVNLLTLYHERKLQHCRCQLTLFLFVLPSSVCEWQTIFMFHGSRSTAGGMEHTHRFYAFECNIAYRRTKFSQNISRWVFAVKCCFNVQGGPKK